MQKIQIFDEVYCANLQIIVGDKDECEKYLGKTLPDFDFLRTFGELSLAETIAVPSWGYIVWLPEPIKGKEEWWMGVLAHEIYHVVYNVLQATNVKDEEAGAYYYESLFRRIWDKLGKKPKRRKKP